MERRRSWLALVITALVAVLGVGRPVAAASSGSALITSIAAPSAPGALRGPSDPAAHTPKGDARDGDADALPPSGGFDLPAAHSLAIASLLPTDDDGPAQTRTVCALPRGPPAFV